MSGQAVVEQSMKRHGLHLEAWHILNQMTLQCKDFWAHQKKKKKHTFCQQQMFILCTVWVLIEIKQNWMLQFEGSTITYAPLHYAPLHFNSVYLCNTNSQQMWSRVCFLYGALSPNSKSNSDPDSNLTTVISIPIVIQNIHLYKIMTWQLIKVR